MMLAHECLAASGTSNNECHWIGLRFDREFGFNPNEGETWIGQGTAEGQYALMSQRGWMTGLWRSKARYGSPSPLAAST